MEGVAYRQEVGRSRTNVYARAAANGECQEVHKCKALRARKMQRAARAYRFCRPASKQKAKKYVRHKVVMLALLSNKVEIVLVATKPGLLHGRRHVSTKVCRAYACAGIARHRGVAGGC